MQLMRIAPILMADILDFESVLLYQYYCCWGLSRIEIALHTTFPVRNAYDTVILIL
jgi:hypothetical protein